VIRLLAALVLAPALVPHAPRPNPPAAAARPERRWKINTHLFAANKALADAIADGMVTIPPFGEIPVAPAALQALREWPAAYRAGVLGPDLFPDMYFGGWIIHSDLPNAWNADAWLRHVWNRAWSWPDASERSKALAFAYGFLTHGAGDMWAHTWVNQKADGAWVSFWGKSKPTAFKHIVLEGYVGDHTPKSDLSIDVWPGFVSNVLIRDPTARRYSQTAKYYQKWLQLYDWLDDQVKRAKSQMNQNISNDAPYWAKCSLHPVACAKKEQMETWQLDIKRGFRAMVDSSESLGERLMEGEAREGASAMTGWMTEWIPKMFGAHAIGEGAAALQAFLSWVADAAAPISEPIKDETERFFKKWFAEIYDLYQTVTDPASYMDQIGFPPGTKQQVNQEMGIPSGAGDFDWRTFEPIYNSVILSKLVLLDANGLNELARRAGIKPLFPPGANGNVMLGVFRSLTQSYQWKGEVVTTETTFGICGTEDGELPKTAQCGQSGGFVLWSNPEARQKVFGVIFKGYGPGPGTAVERITADLPFAGAAVQAGGRGLRLAADQTEYMREIVAVMQGKIGGVATAAAVVSQTQRAPAPTPAPAPAPPAGRPGVPAPRATPAPAPAPAPAAGPAPQVITDWGRRCCARDIAELRAALSLLQSSSRSLQNPAVLAHFGRRPTASQLGAIASQLNSALDAFANTRDATTAAAALSNFSRGLDMLARLVAGT
jgi:hypothetical protein